MNAPRSKEVLPKLKKKRHTDQTIELKQRSKFTKENVTLFFKYRYQKTVSRN